MGGEGQSGGKSSRQRSKLVLPKLRSFSFLHRQGQRVKVTLLSLATLGVSDPWTGLAQGQAGTPTPGRGAFAVRSWGANSALIHSGLGKRFTGAGTQSLLAWPLILGPRLPSEFLRTLEGSWQVAGLPAAPLCREQATEMVETVPGLLAGKSQPLIPIPAV